jgi:type I restriction enzyme R subunit
LYNFNLLKELDKEKLSAILELKYKTIADAKQVLGDPIATRNIFIDFQKHLYSQVAV